MKTPIRILALVINIALLPLSLATLNSCKDCGCTESSSDADASRDIKDLNTESEFYQQNVAEFKLTQTTTFSIPNSSDCDCLDPRYVTKLSITNKTNKTISIDQCTVYFTLDTFQWSYNKNTVTTIAPNSTLEVGEVSTDGTDITTGQMTIVMSGVEYEG
jgi:hypothetical protein